MQAYNKSLTGQKQGNESLHLEYYHGDALNTKTKSLLHNSTVTH